MSESRFRIEFTCDGRVAEAVCSDTPELKMLADVLQDVVAHPEFEPGVAVMLVDQGTAFNPPREAMQSVTEILEPYLDRICPRMAIVVAKNLHFGLGMMMNAFLAPLGLEFRPFKDADEARAWLIEAREP